MTDSFRIVCWYHKYSIEVYELGFTQLDYFHEQGAKCYHTIVVENYDTPGISFYSAICDLSTHIVETTGVDSEKCQPVLSTDSYTFYLANEDDAKKVIDSIEHVCAINIDNARTFFT